MARKEKKEPKPRQTKPPPVITEQSEEPDDNFRDLPIYPTAEDIKRQSVPKLAANLIDKPYDSSDHYLRTHFSLLREELVRPLVDSVNKLRQILTKDEEVDSAETQDNGRGIAKKKKTLEERIEEEVEANVFFDIQLMSPYVQYQQHNGMILKFTFDHKRLELDSHGQRREIDLQDCPQLMDGNLLCLSTKEDNFNDKIIFGLIVDSQVGVRDRESNTNEKLWEFCLKLDLGNNESQEFCEFLSKPGTKYVGVESPAYYEGFRHSLKTLQSLGEDFPLKRYIVDLKQDILSPPYLTKDVSYNLSCIEKSTGLPVASSVNDSSSDEIYDSAEEQSRDSNSEAVDDYSEAVDEESDEKLSPLSLVEILRHNVFPIGNNKYDKGVSNLKQLSTFDTRQFDAFYAALTKQLCVIEGPPGTGKTFVGLKIVKCLLDNVDLWNGDRESITDCRPILVVCFKNHALDQFLEGIVKFNDNVVRIGGKSESKDLDPYKLGLKEEEFREKVRNGLRKGLDSDCLAAHKQCQKPRNRIKAIREDLEEMCKVIVRSDNEILTPEEINPYIKPKRLTDHFPAEDYDAIYDWLNYGNDPGFRELCKTKLKLEVNKQLFDDVDDLVKQNLEELSPKDKWVLYLYWRDLLLQDYCKQIAGKCATIGEELIKLRVKRVQLQKTLCKGAQVIGLTVTGAAKYKALVEAFNPRIMIVEEAAEVLEGHVVAAMSSNIDHAIFIGDHKQLRPLTTVQELTDDYHLDISLFERLVKNKLPFVALELQHRMLPCISELLKVANIYDFLRNGEKVHNYPPIKFTYNKSMYFLDHQNIEDSNMCRDVPDKSRSNRYEAKLVVQLVKYFLLRNYAHKDITVLAAYNAQVKLIKQQMLEDEKFFVEEPEETDPVKPVPIVKGKRADNKEEKVLKVRVSSVDGFQGEENDIIIISFVRSSKKNAIGFLGNKNRINVALSRARHGLFCVGNFTIMAKEEESKMWANLVRHLKKEEAFGDEFTLGCVCTNEQHISMPGQLDLLNLQIRNGICKCQKRIN